MDITPPDLSQSALRAAVAAAAAAPATSRLILAAGMYQKLTGGPLVMPAGVDVLGGPGAVIRCGAGSGVQWPEANSKIRVNINGVGECALPLLLGTGPGGLGAKADIKVTVSQAAAGGRAAEVRNLQNSDIWMRIVNNPDADGVLVTDGSKNCHWKIWPTRCKNWAVNCTTTAGSQRTAHHFFVPAGLSEGSDEAAFKFGDCEDIEIANFVMNGITPVAPQGILLYADSGRVDVDNNVIGPRTVDQFRYRNLTMKGVTNSIRSTARVDIFDHSGGSNSMPAEALSAGSTITRLATTLTTF